MRLIIHINKRYELETVLIENVLNVGSLLIGVLSAAIGGIGGWILFRYRKRNEEVNTTGNEHDTVKRISQSSIETIERYTQFSEDLTNKMIEQRKTFNENLNNMSNVIDEKDIFINKLESELEEKTKLIKTLQEKINAIANQ